MNEETRKQADRRFEEALEATDARDPRDFYRELLRELKDRDAEAYERAVDHFTGTLIPGIASGELEPLRAWREYGRKLAEWIVEGRTVEIDETGRARPHEPSEDDAWSDAMVLHLPVGGREKAILVSLPAEPTPAQRATYDLLVAGRQTLRG